jgi:purine-nucleoside phosphorylase
VEDLTADPFAAAAASASALAQRTAQPRHEIAVVLGSGWAPAADALGTVVAEVPLDELGGFPAPAVAGHVAAVRSVSLDGIPILVFLGRVHLYEGHSPAAVVHGVRTAIAAGCSTVVLTNAAGGIRAGLRPGQPVLISDQLNLTGSSPLAALPADGQPDRPLFADMTEVYSPRLRTLAQAKDPALEEGVYAAMLGPQYETPAEIRMLRSMGADLVGMSTALEAIAARHLGAEVLGFSLVTNVAAGLSEQTLDHQDVLSAGRDAAAALGLLLAAILAEVRQP